MRDVHDTNVRNDPDYHSLADRHSVIRRAEIGHKDDRRPLVGFWRHILPCRTISEADDRQNKKVENYSALRFQSRHAPR